MAELVPRTHADESSETTPPLAEVAVIIPTFNDGARLAACVDAVLCQQTGVPFEVLIVDNGSDPPVSSTWTSRVRVVREPKPGSYAARNTGIRASTAHILVFTDSDCIPQPGWMAAGIAAIEAGMTVVTGPVVLTVGDPPSVTELYELRYGFPQDRYLREGFGVTANLFVHRSAIEEGGVFDAELRSGGDREFGQRLAAKGIRTEWAAGAVVEHPARARISQLLAKTRRTEGGNAVRYLRETNRARVLLNSLWLLRPPIRALVNILREEGSLTILTRLQLAGLVVLVRATACGARLRVVAGREANR